MQTALKSLTWLVVLAALAALPWVITSSYYLPLITTIVIYSIVVLGLDIVFGYTGEVSIGHAALFGLGAYAAGLMWRHFGLGFWPALPTAIVVTALFGALLALPALNVTGPYLSMVTLAFGTIVMTLINEMTDLGPWLGHLNLTNGPLGIELKQPLFLDISDWIDIFTLLRDERQVFRFWRELVSQHDVRGKNAHDARLVAAMLRHGVNEILTFNTADFARYPGITVLDPHAIPASAAP